MAAGFVCIVGITNIEHTGFDFYDTSIADGAAYKLVYTIG